MSDTPTKLEIVEQEQPSALEAIERASIDMQISTAKRFPRTLSKVKADMLSFATLDEETAQACFYTLPRGGKTIQGPSVRLAEIAVSCYGNLRAGARPIQTVTSGDHPHVIVQAVAHDLEKNVAIQIEKRRRIVGKKSKGGLIDEDDINLAVNACAAIAFRDAVFKVVPTALIRPVFEQAKQVAIGDIKSLAKKRGQVVDRLKAMGATEERILARVEAKKLEDIDLSKLETLIGLGTALKDGETSLEEAFPAVVAAVKPSFGAEAPSKPASTEPAGQSTPPPAGDNGAQGDPATGSVAVPHETVQAAGADAAKMSVQDQLDNLCLDHGVSETALLNWAKASKHITADVTALASIPDAKKALFVKNFAKIAAAINPPTA